MASNRLRQPYNRTIAGLLLSLLVAAWPVPGVAADEPPPPKDFWSMQAADAVGNALASLSFAATSTWGSFTSFLKPTQPYEVLPDQLGEDDRRFFASLETLGLKLGEVTVRGAVLPYAGYRFVAAREPSDADIERARRELESYRRSYDSLRAKAKQGILRALIDIAGDKTYVVTAVNLDLALWPSASYEINRRDRPLEAPERRVVDALHQD
jgi:hypothetical protein